MVSVMAAKGIKEGAATDARRRRKAAPPPLDKRYYAFVYSDFVKTPRRPPLRLLSPIHRASRQVGRYLEGRSTQLGVSPPEGHLVTYLSSYAPSTIGELGRVFGLKGSTLTSMLDRLEAARLVVRRDNPDDRRSFLVELTAAGEKVAAALRQEIESLEEEVLRRLPHRDLAGFRAVLAALETITGARQTEGEDS
jgi:DNA-binding MarR family transcriptional regulator